MVAYGLRHVLSMYAGVVAVPLVVGTALELDPRQITYLISAGLFISGLATLLQTLGVWRIGARLPIVQGTSFAAVSTMVAIGAPLGGEAGLRARFGALLVVMLVIMSLGQPPLTAGDDGASSPGPGPLTAVHPDPTPSQTSADQGHLTTGARVSPSELIQERRCPSGSSPATRPLTSPCRHRTATRCRWRACVAGR